MEGLRWPHCSTDLNHDAVLQHILKIGSVVPWSTRIIGGTEEHYRFQQSLKLAAYLWLMMFPPTQAKILIGIPPDPNDSKGLLSWAVNVLAHPNDIIVAVHILVGKGKTKPKRVPKRQSRLRRAQAYVISVLGEFAQACQSKQVNLEGKVGFSSSIRRGLLREAKFISADYLLLGGSRNLSDRTSRHITRYCFENAPESTTVVSIGQCKQKLGNLLSVPAPEKDFNQSSSSSSEKGIHSERTASPGNKRSDVGTRTKSSSPKAVLDALEAESHSTEDDTFTFGDSTVTDSCSIGQRSEIHSYIKKPSSPCRIISLIFRWPLRMRQRILHKKKKQQPLLKCFSYEEISIATNNFHPDNIVGRGGYSEVYRGSLSDGRPIAVKRLAKDNKDPKKEKEFLMELGIIGHVNHPNTASLVGYCIENGLYLIFNFSQNGNLASALHGKTCKPLEWQVRYRIAIGVARGLHYLHKCCKHRIIHRDIKASNVLLGPDYEPQITDFGLAKWLPNKWTHHAVIPVEGTFGYLAPEYFMHGLVDEKTDVFAFGVLLLEIITGRRPVDSSKQNLLLWAKPLMESGNINELADPKLESRYNEDQMRRLVLTASYCVKQSSMGRPSMSEVIELLTTEHEQEIAKSWRIQKSTSESDELDDFSMVFGYDIPSDIELEDYL